MIILITGKAGCGKDTAFKIIKKYATGLDKRYAFADPMNNVEKALRMVLIDCIYSDEFFEDYWRTDILTINTCRNGRDVAWCVWDEDIENWVIIIYNYIYTIKDVDFGVPFCYTSHDMIKVVLTKLSSSKLWAGYPE